MRAFDVIVVGLGGVGSAITYNLASHGVKTLGLERFSLNHTNGSSHGRTRIIRTAYFEHPNYVPLVRRALELWFDLQKQSGIGVIRMTGGLVLGGRESDVVKGSLASARQHNLPHEILTPDQVESRFPMFQVDDEVAVYEKNAGILFPEKCIEAHAKLATAVGAELHFSEPVVDWGVQKDGVIVKTGTGLYGARYVVFASGAWSTELLSELRLPLQCERQTVFWFKPSRNRDCLTPDRMPIFVWQQKDESFFYGIPDLGEGVKAARHHGGEETLPDAVNRKVTEQDEMPVRHFLDAHIPRASGPILSSTTCLYTNSPDGHFVIDYHPQHRNIIIVSACSGHGFKFASAIGEAVREMIASGKTTYDISLFSAMRFEVNSLRH